MIKNTAHIILYIKPTIFPMQRKEHKQIKIEEREDHQGLGPTRWIPGEFIKIEFDPEMYPPIKWAPLKPLNAPAEMAELEPASQQPSSSRWMKIMKKILTKLLNIYIGSIQRDNLLMKFKKWKHSSTFIFVLLMFVYHRIPNLKNNFCDSYQQKIQNLQAEKFDENDVMHLRESINIVLQFFIGDPMLAIEQFYRKYRSELNYDPLKAKKFMKILEKAIIEDQSYRQIELDFVSADIYEQDESQRREEVFRYTENKSIKSGEISHMNGNGNASEDNNYSQQIKTRGKQNNGVTFLIYRKNDTSKTPLYPIDLKFTIKNAYNDLFPV